MTRQLLSESTIENVTEVLIVLGKRLVNDELTEEGRSRVSALVEVLPRLTHKQVAIMFCGGGPEEHARTEAEALFEHFTQLAPNFAQYLSPQRIMLENQSTNSVQNLIFAADLLADQLLAEQLFEEHLGSKISPICIRLVSSDYHIERIIEIEKLMPEQGLVGRFIRHAQQRGISIDLPLVMAQHTIAQYPYQTEQGKAFLLIDKLTTYRVYLEGVVAGVFQRPLASVRKPPYQLALTALSQLRQLDCMYNSQVALRRLTALVEQTSPEVSLERNKEMLVEFNHLLLTLNRQFDPDAEHNREVL
ncbi:YdcF family protein [Vibrio rhodolitus]|uniref:YdcF family protein n=1 Tax=Vibrio rhodolitus TaxID=2231649 RepID=UPI000E0BEA60|nr:YdcF family protein [Vibrio rhodolitus]